MSLLPSIPSLFEPGRTLFIPNPLPVSRLTVFSKPMETQQETVETVSPTTGQDVSVPLTRIGSITDLTKLFADIMKQTQTANVQNVQSAASQSAALATQIASQLDPYVAGRFYEGLAKAFPGYRETFGQMTANVQSMLRGELPSDVADVVRMVSAEQERSGALAATARNLGLTSLDIATQGFGMGAQLYDIAGRYLTPPTADVFATAEGIRNQLIATGTMTPAQAGQLALQARAQDIDQLQFAQNYALQRDKLRVQMDQFNANLAWQQELSQLNRQYEKWRYKTELDLYQQAQRARREEQEALTSAFEEVASTLRGGRTRTPVSRITPTEDEAINLWLPEADTTNALRAETLLGLR